MQRISSNLTLFFKFFVPIFWIVFFGAVTVAALLYDFEYVGDIPARNFRFGILAFYLSGGALLTFTLMRLKRVEADEEYFYVTNYFKTARYPFHSIEKVVESRLAIFTIVSLRFAAPGIFGKQATFLASRQRLRDFWEAQPELRQRWRG
jgi:hypothetical protein